MPARDDARDGLLAEVTNTEPTAQQQGAFPLHWAWEPCISAEPFPIGDASCTGNLTAQLRSLSVWAWHASEPIFKPSVHNAQSFIPRKFFWTDADQYLSKPRLLEGANQPPGSSQRRFAKTDIS